MKTKSVMITFAIIVAALVSKAQVTDTLTDTRDGKKYKTVTIGTQTWMAENLNYSADDSWCYGNSPTNCDGFGKLYSWQVAKTVCPGGWHLPSKSEFETLLSNVGGSGINAYQSFKEGGSSGFAALFGGWRNSKGQYGDLGRYGHWWSSSEGGARSAWGLTMNSEIQFSHLRYLYRDWGFCVRCLKD